MTLSNELEAGVVQAQTDGKMVWESLNLLLCRWGVHMAVKI
jgi:hypothetical protein